MYNEIIEERLLAFEMYCYRQMLWVSRTERKK